MKQLLVEKRFHFGTLASGTPAAPHEKTLQDVHTHEQFFYWLKVLLVVVVVVLVAVAVAVAVGPKAPHRLKRRMHALPCTRAAAHTLHTLLALLALRARYTPPPAHQAPFLDALFVPEPGGEPLFLHGYNRIIGAARLRQAHMHTHALHMHCPRSAHALPTLCPRSAYTLHPMHMHAHATRGARARHAHLGRPRGRCVWRRSRAMCPRCSRI